MKLLDLFMQISH